MTFTREDDLRVKRIMHMPSSDLNRRFQEAGLEARVGGPITGDSFKNGYPTVHALTLRVKDAPVFAAMTTFEREVREVLPEQDDIDAIWTSLHMLLRGVIGKK